MTDTMRAPAGFRVPPSDIETEQSLLGAILINNRAYHAVADFLRPEHFYEPVHQRIYLAASTLIEAGGIADYRTLRAAFDADDALKELNGSQYLADMARVAETIVNAEPYGQAIHEIARRRAIIKIAEDAANEAYESCVDSRTAAEQIQSLQANLDQLSLDQPVNCWQSVGEIVDRIASRMDGPSECYTTGLPSLDRSMEGGIRPGLVYGVEARPKRAKTMLLGTLSMSLMRQNVPSLFLALEMGSDRILERMIAHETRCNAIRFRKVEDREDVMSRLTVFGDRYRSRRAYFADEPGVTFQKLKSIAGAAVAKLGIRVLFLDYWQLVTGCPRGQSKADFMGDVAQWIAAFAPANHCAVVMASQENRTGESYGSDGLAKACDWLAVLHKLDWNDRAVGEFEALWMDVKFNRDGVDTPIGSDDAPAFRIDKLGPVVREFGDWSR